MRYILVGFALFYLAMFVACGGGGNIQESPEPEPIIGTVVRIIDNDDRDWWHHQIKTQDGKLIIAKSKDQYSVDTEIYAEPMWNGYRITGKPRK